MRFDHITSKVGSVYEVKVSNYPIDSEWDNFVLKTPGGHYAQTALWAQAQAIRGWQTLRIVLKEQDNIIAGAQILTRTLPIVGSLGYLSWGPVCDVLDLYLSKLVVNEIQKVCKQSHIFYLVLKPPDNGEKIAHLLPGLGFHDATDLYGQTASVVIDLTQDIDCILAQLSKFKRQTIRRIERRGALIRREGTQQDIPGFYRLYALSSQRIGFTPYPEKFYQELWRVFEPRGYLKLFLSEYEGEPVSSLLTIPFKDSVTIYKLGWSGAYSNLYPNDTVYWEAIRWAKSNGYHYFDLGGVNAEAAQATLQNKPIPEWVLNSFHRFKLDYGGQIIFYPNTFDNINIPFLNWGYRSLYPWIKNRTIIKPLFRKYRRRTEKQ